MEMYNDEQTVLGEAIDKTAMVYQKTRDWIASFLGIITTIAAVIVMFFVASVEGEIDFAKTIKDATFWVLTGLAAISAIFSSYINYTSTVEQTKGTQKFLKTLKYYSEVKEKAREYLQYIPDFCAYKNQQVYENAKRNIVENANITYKRYISSDFDYNSLEKWQKKELKKIQKIKIKRLTQSDLLQEKSEDKTRIQILPMSEDVAKTKFLTKTVITRAFTMLLSGFTMTLGFTLGNWALGLTYGISIIMSSVMSIVQAVSFTQTVLRNRYIAKSDLLNEFYNIKDMFIQEENEN